MDDSGSSPVGRGLEFEQFVLEILTHSPDLKLPATVSGRGLDGGYDMAATRDGRTVLVEAKVVTPQTPVRLRDAIARLQAAAARYVQTHDDADPELVLAFPGVLARSKATMVHESRVTIWDGKYLREKAYQLGISVPPYIASFESTGLPDEDTGHAQDLISQLTAILRGSDQWVAYEKYCEELLNYLFVPPLNTVIPQSRDDHHANRRDFVLPNYTMDGSFWQFMRSHYEAHYVVAEVKNLSGSPGKREILQVANYLNRHGTGLFSIILARREMDPNAKWTCREQWIQHNKLIIGLDDDDVRQMLVTKQTDGDPAELIRQKIEDFRLGI